MKNLQLESGVFNLIAKKFLFNFIQIPHTSRLGFVMAYYKNIKLFFQKEMESVKSQLTLLQTDNEPICS